MLVDHFKVRGLVGRGGMGSVYLARDVRLGRKVALKVIHTEQLTATAVDAFLEEARVTARFSHPHIVGIYGAGEVDGRPYLALEFLEGRSLRQQLEQERVPVGRAVRIALAVAEALAEAHDAGVLHRDLKPENIFLPRDGRVRVVDFGLARAADGTLDGEVAPLETGLAGTPLYMAPEQWTEQQTSSASDIWAFGLCLFETLAGGHPFMDFDDANIARLRARMQERDLDLPELPDAEAVPEELRSVLADCLAPEPDDRPSARQLVQRLDGILHNRRSEDDSEEPPYRGLLPFTEEHADQFHGREGELALFVERLRTEPILPVVGPSGAGKSSFVAAGVVPRLRENAYWTVLRMRPGRTPFDTLATRLLAKETRSVARVSAAHTLDFFDDAGAFADVGTSGPDRRSPLELAATLREAPGTLHLVLSELAEEQRCQVLLVVDQLEELFALVDDEAERRAFLTALCLAADDPSDPVRVVFTVRDDFLGRLAEAPAAAETLDRVALIRPLGADALRETLVRPLQTRGYTFDDPELADEMVAEVADSPAGLPLLQFAARMLWDRRDRRERVLRRRHYEQLGGVVGALARHGDEVLAGMSAERQDLARQLLLRLLSAEGTRRTIPWREAVDGLPERDAEATLERLVASRLLVVHEGRERLVELAHESLVRSWSRLRRWHAESREEVRMVTELEDAARLWERRGRRPGELWSGETLMDAQRLMEGVELPLSSRAQTFLDAATVLRNRAARNRRLFAWAGVGLLALIAVGSTGAAWEIAQQRQVAVAQAEAATRARAEALTAGAHAAYASGDTLAARAQLRSALSVRDSAAARALWWQVNDDVVVWSLDTPYRPHGHALARDGQQVAVAASDGILRVFDNRTGAVRSYRTTGKAGLSAAAFDPASGAVAAADFDGSVWVWPDGGEARQLTGTPADTYPYALSFLPDGRLMLYVYWPDGFDTAQVIWGPDGGAPEVFKGTRGHGRMAVSPDGTALVSGNPRGGSVSWHGVGANSRRTLGTLGQSDRVGRFAFSEDGQTVAAVGRSVVLFDVEGGELARFEGHPSAVRGADFLDGDRLAAVGLDGTVRVWSVPDGALLRTVDLHLSDGVSSGSFTPDGRAHLSLESSMVHADLRRTGSRSVDRGHVGFLEGIAIDPGGAWVATGGQDGAVRVWDRATGAQTHVLRGLEGSISDLRVDATGTWLAGGSASGEVALWTTADWRLAKRLDHPADLKGTVFTDDGRTLLTATYNGRLRSWDLGPMVDEGPSADTEVQWLLTLDTNVFDLDLVPGSDRYVASDFYGRLHTGRLGRDEVRVIEAHRAQAHTVIARADGTAVSLGFDDHLRGWDLSTGDKLFELPTEGASGVGVHPDGTWAVLGDGEGTWRVPLPAGERLPLAGPEHGPSGVRFDAAGTLLGIGDDAGTLWLVDPTNGMRLWHTVLAEGERVLTHRGWEPSAPAGDWAALLEAEGQVADVEGDTLCAALRDGTLVRWDRGADQEVGRWPVRGRMLEVAAAPDGCFARTAKELWRTAGPSLEPLSASSGGWRRLLPIGQGWVAATTSSGAWLFGPEGEPRELDEVGLTALRLVDGRLWMGTSDGGFDAVEGGLRDPAGPRLQTSWVRPPASAVVAIEPGPGDTVFTAHRDGQLVLWDIDSGAHLADRKLHGPPKWLQPTQMGLVASTDVGDVERLDLSVFAADRCAVLSQVEAVISTVWAGDRIALSPEPSSCP